MDPITVTFFGISGSGKGTQVSLLIDHLSQKDGGRKIVHAEMGAMLRDFMKDNSELAKRSKQIVDAGGLLPTFIPVCMLARRLEKEFKGDEHLVIDGTPRRPMQAELVDENVRFYGRDNLHAIVLDLSIDSARKRLAGRGTGRADDTDEKAMNERFSWYQEHVVPSIAKLEELRWKIHHIDGEPDVPTIHKNIIAALGV